MTTLQSIKGKEKREKTNLDRYIDNEIKKDTTLKGRLEKVGKEMEKEIEEYKALQSIKERAEREFEKEFENLEYKLEATKSRIPVNTKEGVADLGTMIALALKDEIKSFLLQQIELAYKQGKEKGVDEGIDLADRNYKKNIIPAVKKEAYRQGGEDERKRILNNLPTPAPQNEKNFGIRKGWEIGFKQAINEIIKSLSK